MASEKEELSKQLSNEERNFKKLQKRSISVDMTRGRPGALQLDIAMPMLKMAGELDYVQNGIDARNYGDLAGIPAARELFAQLFEVSADEVIVSDGSSLDIMYTLVQFAMQFGVLGTEPWNKLQQVKFLCPAPGYDRHFAICRAFGIDMLTVPMLDDGPDMDMVEELVRSDDSVKGIWCVPKYSNPTGVVFCDRTVERMASLKPAAKDFRVFWDNAYIMHTLNETDVPLANIFDLARKAGNADMIYSFTSTSKITFAGSGLAAMAASKANIDDILSKLAIRKINSNKVNQVMHVAYLRDKQNISLIMQRHAMLLRPKFQLFERRMSEAFGDCADVKWSRPGGGYFISLDVEGCAKRIVELCAQAGIKITPAGSTFPYGFDDKDSNLRIAPSVPTLEEMDFALDVLIEAIKIALLEKQIAKMDV